MRSIRLSLVVYFTLLLTASLGTVFWFYYHDVSRTVHTNEHNTEKLYETQYKEECKKINADFDEKLLRRAQDLAGLERSNPRFEALIVLGQMATAPGPLAHLPTAVWAEHSVSRYLQNRQYVLRPVDIHFKAAALGDPLKEYYQVFRENGEPANWPGAEDALTLDDDLKKTELYKHQFDDLELEEGLTVRRVTMKVAVARFRSILTRPQGSKGPAPSGKAPPPPGKGPPPRDRFLDPNIYIQYAANTEARDDELAKKLSDKTENLDKLKAVSRQEIHDVQVRLVWLSLATLLAIVVGTSVLVRAGLQPLARLSDAVSKVSEKDMRLHFDDRKLPSELAPIVTRLQQSLQLLKRAFAREKQAAADISHELRTPLAALLTTIDVALRKPRSTEEYRELLENCRASGQQMTQLVERMLALARLDSGVDQVRTREVDVEGLADQCAGLVRPLAEARGLTLRVHHKGPAPLTTDPDKLREVLTNLLHNAIEYNTPEGSIDIEVERANGNLNVEVRDTGIGISPEARQHIFERFYRADPSRQSEGLHAGIGLAIVKGYVELMGGDIEVDSVLGKGSTFRLRLPARVSK